MSSEELQLVFRRSFVGHRLVAAIETLPIRVQKHDKPVERFVLTPAQAKYSIDALIELAAADKLTKWAAPPPPAKTVHHHNSELAKTANAKALA